MINTLGKNKAEKVNNEDKGHVCVRVCAGDSVMLSPHRKSYTELHFGGMLFMGKFIL